MSLGCGAVIGKGSIGYRHVELLHRALPGQSHLHIGSREFDAILEGLPNRTLVPSELRDIDFIIVASPATRHLHHVTAGTSWGLPVLLEKPIASILDDAQQLVHTATGEKSIAQVGYVLRYSEAFTALAEIVAELGTGGLESAVVVAHSFLPDWRPGKDFRNTVSARLELGGGVLLELSHELDYLLTLCGPLEIVSADLTQLGSLNLEVETAALVRAHTSTGADVSISLDMNNPDTERYCEMRWSDGVTVRWDLVENSLTMNSSSSAKETLFFQDSKDDWFTRQFASFEEAVSLRMCPSPSLYDGLEVVRLIDSIRQASEKNS